MHILFSIPVHENNGMVRLTIANVRQHVRECTVVLHVSEGFGDFDASIGELPGVLINPVRTPTVHGHSQMGIHLTNHAHAAACGVAYDFFCSMHTSEMFVRHGVEELIAKHEYAAWFTRQTQPRGVAWHPMMHALRFGLLKGLLPDDGWYLGHIIEGMWFSRRIMDTMYALLSRSPTMLSSQVGWTLEEILLPTLANLIGGDGRGGEPFNAFFDKDLEMADVDAIVAGKPYASWQLNQWNGTGTPVLSDGSTKFTIKRLRRDINDPVRQHIINLTGLDLGAVLGGQRG